MAFFMAVCCGNSSAHRTSIGLDSGGYTAYAQGKSIGIDHFGASAPGNKIMHEYGFNVENVCMRAKRLIK